MRLFHLQQEPSGKGNRSVVAFHVAKHLTFFLGLFYFPNRRGWWQKVFWYMGHVAMEPNACRDTDPELLEAAILFSSHISCSWFSSHVSFPPHPSWVYLNIFLAFKPTEGLVFVFFLKWGRDEPEHFVRWEIPHPPMDSLSKLWKKQWHKQCPLCCGKSRTPFSPIPLSCVKGWILFA